MKGTLSPKKNPPQQDDPRIDALIRGYTRLFDKVEALAEKVEERQEESKKSEDELTVDIILAELHQKKESEAHPLSAALQERAPPEPEQPPTVRAALRQASVKKKIGQKHLAPEKPHRTRQGLKIVGSVAFYGALMLLIVGALLIRATSNGAPRSLAGFTGMVVLTESMQSEIPKGSLVIARQIDPKTLQIGDDITYMANQTTTITHRIVGIIENYENTGQRAFQTQGIMNAQPDKQPVPAANVVGKVVFHSVVLGMIAEFIGQYWLFLLFALAVIIVLALVLKRIYKKEPKETTRH